MVGPGLVNSTPGAPHVLVAGTVQALAKLAAQRFVDALAFRLKDEWVSAAHIALSGGVAIEALIEEVADSLAKHRVDWERVHVWWTDERYLPEGAGARFEMRARSAGLIRIGIREDRIHPIPPSAHLDDETPDRAATEYDRLLRRYAPHGRSTPMFDLVLLELGADGSVAGLYPGHAQGKGAETVIPVWDAPPPTKLRVTMTVPTLSGAARVWVLGMGADRADAAREAVTLGSATSTLPAAHARGILETLWWLDEDAANGVPRGRTA